MTATGDTSAGIDHPFVGPLELLADSGPDGAAPEALFCENETNDQAPVRHRTDHAVPQGRHQ